MAETRSLLVVADDGGMDGPRDQGILEVLEAGLVRNVSVVANGAHAASLAVSLRAFPGVSVVLHLNLTEGRPLAGPAATLTGPDGLFLGDKRAFWDRAHEGGVDPAEVAREAAAQVALLREFGLEPAGLNGHNHVHVLPGVREGVRDLLARDLGIGWVRIPAEPEPPPDSPTGPVDGPAMPFHAADLDETGQRMLRYGHRALASLRALATRTAMTLPPRVRFADSFLGFAFACSGSAAALEAGLRTVQGGVVELMVHPGRSDPRARSSFARDPARESERKVLLSDDFREAVAAAGFAPASFAEMDGGPA
ncbi:MAG: ChbG/HpnK family deacetylase [Planctomycetes bacterium]|nr:ChbG/HpnK family deacetylase [Planctomycetota bacterium]